MGAITSVCSDKEPESRDMNESLLAKDALLGEDTMAGGEISKKNKTDSDILTTDKKPTTASDNKIDTKDTDDHNPDALKCENAEEEDCCGASAGEERLEGQDDSEMNASEGPEDSEAMCDDNRTPGNNINDSEKHSDSPKQEDELGEDESG